ncbi:NAD(P)/FAD-dependent oxidoreductase [Halovenus halobia]|uniref:NAD(P)/FAD-dependent oxidoreductase n=1 Tax=Halovenus halobia TaxID=3396622 RepID=UPI003F554663
MTLATIDRYDPDRVQTVGDRAVVLGGSIAGLCAARVLADGFDNVVVLERDPFPDEPVTRDGAPQTSHPHVMLEGGRATLEDLFPGFSERVLAEGGLMIDGGREFQEYNGGDYIAEPEGRMQTYCASRAVYEYVVREQVRALQNVSLRGDHQFLEYCTDDHGNVSGVQFRDARGDERALATDLVVDATGRTSRTPDWLANHGYEEPATDAVTIDVAYSTVRINRPPEDRRMLLVAPDAPRTRGGALIPVEGGRWEVIIQGIHGDDPPTQRDDLLEFADTLPVSEFGTLLRSQEWLSDEAQRYPYPASLWRRYEKLDEFPDGLVVTGDAIASFNPIYGQGMSVAALDALLLHHALADGGLDSLAQRFFERTADLVGIVWQIVVGGDFGFPQTTGPRPTGAAVTNWYMDQVMQQAHTDSVVSAQLARVTRLECPPKTLFHPHIAVRALMPSSRLNSVRSLGNRTAKGVITAISRAVRTLQ